MANTTNTTLTTDTLFVRQLYFKDLVNNPISTNQVLLTRGDGGIYFGSPFSNQSTIPYGFTTFIGGSNLSTVATPSQTTLWLDQGAGIQIIKTTTSNIPHYFIGATAPEQLAVFNGDPNASTITSVLNFSSLQDDLYGGRTLYFQGKDDTVVSISDTTVVFASAYNSSMSSLQELLSTQESVNEYTSTQLSTLSGELSTVNIYLLSTGISTLYSTIVGVQSTANYTSSFVFDHFSTLIFSTVSSDVIPTTSTYTSSLWLFVPSSYTDYVSANVIEAPYIHTSTLVIGSTMINEVELAGVNTNFCSPILPDGTVSTFTDYMLFASPYSSNTTFGIQKEYMYSESTISNVFYVTQGQQVQIGFIPNISTQGNQLPPSIRDQFVPILQQTQVVKTEQSACAPDPLIIEYVLRNTAKLDEICATSTLWLNADNVTIANLNVNTINGQPQITSTFNASTFSTLFWSTSYGENTVLSSLRVSTIMGNTLPILTMDGLNRRVGVNLGPVQQPRATLDVNGIVYAANFVTTSDRSLKWNIRDLDHVDPHELPKAYRFASAEAPEGDIGCMADEVEQVAPECVYTTPSGTKAVAYMKLIPLCFQTIRDLADRVNALESAVLSQQI
jgi:hypothetical protein